MSPRSRQTRAYRGRCVEGPWAGQEMASELTTIFIYESYASDPDVVSVRMAGSYIYQFQVKEWKWVLSRL
jgi:hypothetical protein